MVKKHRVVMDAPPPPTGAAAAIVHPNTTPTNDDDPHHSLSDDNGSGGLAPPTVIKGPSAGLVGPPRDAGGSLGTPQRRLWAIGRQQQRHVLAGLWFVSFVWNVLSPFKNWYLSIYEIASAEVSMNFGMNWWDELDYKYVKFLYDNAGVPCSVEEGQPLRLINVYVDFMVLPRATKWAHGISAWHQDPLVGRYCQSGLAQKREAQGLALESAISNPMFKLWGSHVRHFIPDQQHCHLNEVPAAILCLKGYNATQLMNLEWSTGFDPSDPKVYRAMSRWQAIVFPDLDGCLARRKYLVDDVHGGDKEAALIALAEELTANYSLNPFGYAGKKNLVAVFRDRNGFIDVNGMLSGVRKVSLSGSIAERNRNNYDGDVNAVTVAREAIWVCIFDPGLGLPGTSLEDCLVREGLRLPALFLGDKLFRTAEDLGDRFIDDDTLVEGTPGGVNGRYMTEWNYRPTPVEPMRVKYLRTGNMSGVETSYQNLIDFPLVFEYGGGPQPAPENPSPVVVEYKCIYEDGCASTCHNNTDRITGMYMFYAVRKSGFCYRKRVAPELVNRNGFVSRDCYGIGSGTSTMFYKLSANATAEHGWNHAPAFVEIPNIADPNAILACIMGGRVPVKGEPPFPSGFQNMVSQGTGMVLTVIFGDGSEQVLANMYALISLAGAVMYGWYVLVESYRMLRFIRQARNITNDSRISRQVAFSVTVTTLSFRVWRLHYSHLSLIGFFTFFSWIIGSSNSRCSWYANGKLVSTITPEEMDLSITPTYACRAGNPLAHLSSWFELMRLLASAVVVCFILIGKRHMIGVSRVITTTVVAVFFYGVIPCVLLPMIVIELNHLRLLSPTLALIHNQLFVAIVCALSLMVWKRLIPHYDTLIVHRVLRLMGETTRRIKASYTAQYVITLDKYYGGLLLAKPPDDSEARNWVPLSVLIEYMTEKQLQTLDFARRVFPNEDAEGKNDNALQGKLGSMDTTAFPAWVLKADEFFVSIAN